MPAATAPDITIRDLRFECIVYEEINTTIY